MKSVLREPLVHFLVFGALLSGADRVWRAAGPTSGESRVVVTAGRVEQLAQVFAKTWSRPPTRDELDALVREYVLEEAYYRRAQAMGLDRDDTVVRRRLRQKLEFLTEPSTTLEPTEEELQAYLDAHLDDFRTDATYTLEQILIDVGRHATELELDSRLDRVLRRLRSGQSVSGDGAGLLPNRWHEASASELTRSFGSGFVEAIDELPIGTWEGPVGSGLGVHLVRVDARKAGAVPPLAEVRAAVEREWAFTESRKARQRFNEQLLSEYEVVIEWPSADAAAPVEP